MVKTLPATTVRVSLNNLVELFRAGSKHHAESTRNTKEALLKMAGHHLDFERDVRDIRLADMRTLKSQLSESYQPSTVSDVVFKGLGALFTLALEDGHIEKSPSEKLKWASVSDPEREQPTWEQSLSILQSVTDSTAETGLIVGIMRHFGVGQAEIRHLKGEHIDLERNTIHFRRKKTGKPFDVPIFPHARAFIDSLLAGRELKAEMSVITWRNPRKSLENACKKLGLPTHSPRTFRRTFIIHALEIGVDPRVVAQWQGHRDTTLIFKVYGKYISKEHAAKMAEKLM